MFLQLLASAADQAKWGFSFVAVVIVLVLIPWNRLFSRSGTVDGLAATRAHATSPGASFSEQPAPRPIEPEPHVPQPATPEPEPEPEPPEPEPEPIKPVPTPEPEPIEPVPQPALINEPPVEDDDEPVTVAALHVGNASNVIRIDIAGPKPDGAYDVLPHHHH
jgi:outer membrane biosynthesis protein TonB